MRLGRNSLKLDHCGCTVSYDFDADNPPQTEEGYSNFQTLETCEAHKDFSAKEHYDIVVEENRRKNRAIAVAEEVVPEEKHQEIEYAFDEARTLTVSVPEIPEDDRKEIEAKFEEIPGDISLS